MSKAPTVFLRQDAVSARVGLGRHQIRRLENAGKFPKRVEVGDNSVAWVESEIEAWLQARIAKRDQVAPPAALTEDSPPRPKPQNTKNARLRQQPSV